MVLETQSVLFIYLFIYLFIHSFIFVMVKELLRKVKKMEAFDQNKSAEYKKVKELQLYFKHLFQKFWPKIKTVGVNKN